MSISYTYVAAPIIAFKLIQENTNSVYSKEIKGEINKMEDVELRIRNVDHRLGSMIKDGTLLLTKDTASEFAHGILKLIGEEQ